MSRLPFDDETLAEIVSVIIANGYQQEWNDLMDRIKELETHIDALAGENELAKNVIEELEAKVKRLTSRGFEDLHHENEQLQSRIEAGLKLADQMEAGRRVSSDELRETLGADDE